MMNAIAAGLLLSPVICGAVNCGGHSASTCAECPQGNGAAWCNGECKWIEGTCSYPTVLCATTSSARANSCSQCPSTATQCSSSDCIYHASTGLCREQLTNEVRTASVHLRYPDPSSLVNGDPSWWFNRIEVVDSSSVSYFASNGHALGYGGLQQVDKGNGGSFTGKVIFSLWDQGCDQDVDVDCDPSTLATVTSCGVGVTCEGFGGEGTGKKSWFYFNGWSLRSPFYFVTHARNVGGGRVQYAGYFYGTELGWKHLATFEVNYGPGGWYLVRAAQHRQ